MRTPLPVFVTLMVISAGMVVGVTARPAIAACTSPEQGRQISDTPWHQARWNLDLLPADATGRDVRVAVLDSGVDDQHPQLRNKVMSTDPLRRQSGSQDLCGHGTAVAGLIAARKIDGVRFRGIAPDSFILSARVTERVGRNDDSNPIPATEMAAAVRWAVSNGAKVINISFVYTSDADLAPFKAAIDEAIAEGVVVIAAVGNNQTEGNPTPYPAAWPGVVGVAAVRPDGQRIDESGMGEYVDIAAPGSEITVPRPRGGYGTESGTSFATPIVAGTAALIFSRFPDITGAEVVKRLLATADPAPGGRRSAGYGVGVVNPIRAVTEMIDTAEPVSARPLPGQAFDPVAAEAQARAARIRDRSIWLAGIGILAVVLAISLMVALPAGIRRRWRPAGSEHDEKGR